MLARWLQGLYLLQVSLGAWLGWVWAQSGAARFWLALALALGLPLLLHFLSIASTLLLARWQGDAKSDGKLWWRALVGEYVASLVIFGTRQCGAKPAPQPLPALLANAGSVSAVPVLLVHGFMCNHRVWDDVALALRRSGHAVLTLDLEPLFSSIDDYVKLIEQAVCRLQEFSAAPQLALLGHSMGGLALRAWMRDYGQARVAKVITLGTPHQGTRLAKYARSRNGAQMNWHSDWLKALELSESAASRGLLQIALTTQDNIVFPQREQLLAGAAVTEFAGIGHLQMCLDAKVIDWLVDNLRDAPNQTLAKP